MSLSYYNPPFCDFDEIKQLVERGFWRVNELELDKIGNKFLNLLHRTPPPDLFPPELDSLLETWFDHLMNGTQTVQLFNDTQIVQQGGAQDNRDDLLSHTLPIGHFFDLTGPRRTMVKKFNIHGKEYILRFKNEADMDDLEHILFSVFSIVIDKAFSDGAPEDIVGFQFHHDALDKGVFSCPFRPRMDLTAEKMMELLQKILQSHKEIRLDQDLKITATRIQTPRGFGFRKENVIWNLENWIEKRHRDGRCLIKIHNTDNLCFMRACVVAKALIDKENDPEIEQNWYQIRKGGRGRYSVQRDLALRLLDDAGLTGHTGPCGFNEFQKVQEFLEPEYQIKIFSSSLCNAIVYMGKIRSEKVLHLYLHNEHFSVISTVPAFMNRSYWCGECNKGVTFITRHRCKNKCGRCFGPGRCLRGEDHYCDDCNRRFYSRECYQRHLSSPNFKKRDDGTKKQKSDNPACLRVQRCRDCGRTLNMEKYTEMDKNGRPLHHCGMYFCRQCSIWTKNSETHYCYIQPISKEKSRKNLSEAEIEEREGHDEDGLDAIVRRREREQDGLDPEIEENLEPNVSYVFWDFETFQEREVGQNEYGPIFAHDPTCCVVIKVCTECKENVLARKLDVKCKSCGMNEKLFLGSDCKDQFCRWLFSPDNRGVTAIAHNAKGFDAQFIIQYLIKQATVPHIIPKGLEVMALILKKWRIRVIDSFNFLPMALSALPVSFNIPELKKGFFPFKFFKSENWNYIGPWPDSWFYDPANMSEKKREDFFSWYHQQSGKTFDLQKELLEYCRSDTDILMRACLQFEDEFLDTTGVRPFQIATTIASACNYVFRRNFLRPNSIGLIPYGGYRRRERQSTQALRWLKWLSVTEDLQITHARNGGEKKILKFKLDGYLESNGTKKGYEFYGCVWHGCEMCLPDNRDRKVPGSCLSLEDAYERTVQRAKIIKDEGIELVEIWECQLMKQLSQNKDMVIFFKNCDIKDPLDPRMAFFGGRTNSHYLYYETKDGEKISYVDVMSLYPFVNKWAKYPIGHPQIITEKFATLSQGCQPYFGLIFCKVQPPRQLLIPVLPVKCEMKLLFPLCRKCMEEKNQSSCTHGSDERSLTGVWCSNEVDKALEVGYIIEEVYEVWHYPETALYDGKNPNTGLFTGYVNHFLKHKVEASGWPRGTDLSESSREEFLTKFDEREGIQLNAENMKKNPGIRSQAKLCLNSFWGKFGQRSNMMNGVFFTDPALFMELVMDRTNIIHQVLPLGGEDAQMIYVSYTKEEEFVDVLPNTNVVLAAFTTSTARLKLYGYLEKLGSRVLYMDTDSIIYKTSHGDIYQPPVGCYLGDLTDELSDFGEGAFIDLFIGAGPKNYSFRVRKPDGTTECKVKIRGFTLTHANSNQLNLGCMKQKVKEFLRDGSSNPTHIVAPKIERRKDREVVTTVKRKDYRIIYDKRRILEDGSTLPYGYCDMG